MSASLVAPLVVSLYGNTCSVLINSILRHGRNCTIARAGHGSGLHVEGRKISREKMRENYLKMKEKCKSKKLPPDVNSNGVFACNELDLKEVQVYGFDYDYTLACYKPSMDYLLYNLGRDMLIKKHKYPEKIAQLEYKDDFAVRGLHYDIEKGLLLKLDSFLQIQLGTVYRGLHPVPDDEVLRIYKNRIIPIAYVESQHKHSQKKDGPHRQKMVQLADLFSVPEMGLLCNVTEYFLQNHIDYHPEILFRDVKNSVQSCHPIMHQLVANNVSDYLEPNKDLTKFFDRLKAANKKMFLVTNSPFHFVNKGMKFLVGDDWKYYFDVVIVQARKPRFFTDESRPLRVYDEIQQTQLWDRVTKLEKGTIYLEGTVKQLQDMTGWRGHQVLYFGDHPYSDLADVTLEHGWRTGAIIQELTEKKVKWMSEEEEEEETIPVRSYSDQKRKSSIAFKEIFSTTDEQMREKFVDFDGLDSEIDAEEKSREEIAVNLSKSIEQLSKIRIDPGNLKSKRAVSSSVSIPPIIKKKSFSHSREPSIQSLLEITKSSELITNRERGTTRRSSINFNVGTLGIFSAREIRPRVSENIPVRSMTLDNLIKDEFDEKIANDFADIIEKMIDKLEVIKHTIPASVIDWDESFKSLEECYGDIKSDECALESENGEEDDFCRKFGAEKLQRDRTYISNVLKKLMEELRTQNSYDCLKKEIDDIVKISEDQHNLEVYYEIWSEQLQQLSELIEIEKVNNQLQIKTALSDIEKISDKIEEIINKSALKLNFVEKWEEARLKQQKLLLEMKEQNLNDKLSEYTKKEKVDEIISGELITFCQHEISLMEKQMEDWNNKYNTEIDEFQQEIDEEKGKIYNIKNILEEKIKLRDEQQVVINEFEEEQEKKIKADEYWAAIHRAATIIQSAWRGIMVRKQLGRFKNLWKVLKKRKKLALKKKKKIKNTKLKRKKLLKS